MPLTVILTSRSPINTQMGSSLGRGQPIGQAQFEGGKPIAQTQEEGWFERQRSNNKAEALAKEMQIAEEASNRRKTEALIAATANSKSHMSEAAKAVSAEIAKRKAKQEEQYFASKSKLNEIAEDKLKPTQTLKERKVADATKATMAALAAKKAKEERENFARQRNALMQGARSGPGGQRF